MASAGNRSKFVGNGLSSVAKRPGPHRLVERKTLNMSVESSQLPDRKGTVYDTLVLGSSSVALASRIDLSGFY